MRKIIFNIFLLLVTAVNVFAQEPNKVELYGNSGISFPAGPDEFSDYWKMGFNLGGGIGYPLTPNFVLIGYFDFNSFKFDDDAFLEDYGLGGSGLSVSGGEASVITLSGNLKINLQTSSSQARPYLIGGIGLFKLSVSDMTIYDRFGGFAKTEGDSETAFSVLLGAGIDFAVGERMDLFFEGKYAIGFTEDESTQVLPIKLGLKFR